MRITATLPENRSNHGTTNVGKYRKENSFTKEYAVLVPGENNFAHSIIQLRIYSTNARNYACMWINDRATGLHVSGGGMAGGYGYHRPSAAAKSAIESCGIKLSEDIGGRGDSAIRDALTAIAVAMGYPTYYLHEAHA